MKTPRRMTKENLVFFAEQVQYLLFLKEDDNWDPSKRWDQDTLTGLKDIMQRFSLVPEKPDTRSGARAAKPPRR